MQANGAEMLRLACCLAIERGVKVCAPVHDAILIDRPWNHDEDHNDVMRCNSWPEIVQYIIATENSYN